MAGITSNLYPPIVETYNPVFVLRGVETTCRIYFSPSMYNSANTDAIQISCKNQRTNQNVLKRQPINAKDQNYYPAGIKVCRFKQEKAEGENSGKYYVELNNNDLQEGFENNQYYKVQLRFIKTGIIPKDQPIPLITDSWLTANLSNFSEWSKVCLIRGISAPTLKLLNFNQTSEGVTTLKTSTLMLIGTLFFNDIKEQDTLKSYRAQLYAETSNNPDLLVADSKIVYPNLQDTPNEINYTFNYILNEGITYKLVVEITTNSLYRMEQEYLFSVQLDQIEALPPLELILSEEPEIGSLGIEVKSKDAVKEQTYNVMFRRTSSESNFTIWEDIHEVTFSDRPLNYKWYDYTIKSGVWYQYCVQPIEKHKDTQQIIKRGVITKANAPKMVIFEDMFLCADQKQLRLKYNPQISSLKKNISETKIETMGSPYPFIRRNGIVNYRQFSLSGLITLHTDYQETFVTQDELYGNENITQLYNKYNSNNNIDNYNDFIYEREFREKVIEFLYKDSVKLLRTTTEGNLLIRLMDITLTPETSLGRMLYSFSATAYEVDDYSLINLKKYNIHGGAIYITSDNEIVDPEEGLLKRDFQRFGQISGDMLANKDIIQTDLKDKYSYLKEQGFNINVKYVSKLRIEFQNKPYLIHENSLGQLEPLQDNMSIDSTTILGYLVYINNVLIYVNPEGVYELDQNIKVTSLSFPLNTKVLIDYLVIIQKIETYEHKTDVMSFSTKVGQLWGTFKYKESLIQAIWDKYYGDYKNFNQELVSVNGLRIEANPGTVFWIRDSSSPKLKRITMNDSGLLCYYEDDAVIESLFPYGIHLYPATELDKQREILPENKFLDTKEVVQNLKDIKNPIMNGVYTLKSSLYNISLETAEKDIPKTIKDIHTFTFENLSEETNKYIYYNGQWYPFTRDHDILCSIDAVVDYWCDIVKGVHLI